MERKAITEHKAKKKTIAFVSLGCAKNLVNTEQMMYHVRNAGYAVTGETNGADVVVVNTCGFIESAKAEAIETLLDLAGEKAEGKVGKLIAAGCLPERYKEEVLNELPEVDAILGTGCFDEIVEVIGEVLSGNRRAARFGNIHAQVSEARRIITTSPVWAYLKIAEGCDNRCAYCAIPDIRGSFRSRPMENIIKEARELAEAGIRELILVAQDLTRYGLDLYGKRNLADLTEALCTIDEIKWIRLHYLYPAEIDDKLIEVIAGNSKVLKYLDVPIQHINEGILHKMNRRGDGGEIRAALSKLRERIPGLVIRTSIITGLPGEGEKEFEELCGFLKTAKIERAGIFPYSPEEGTPAALMEAPDQETAVHRADILSDIQSRVMDEFNQSRIESVTTVLIEGREDGRYYGRSFAETPDVDGYIWVDGKNIKENTFIEVLITGVEDGELHGQTAEI